MATQTNRKLAVITGASSGIGLELAGTRPIEALLLNAGVGVGGEFVKTDLDEELRMIAPPTRATM